jgi:hypothetical protein
MGIMAAKTYDLLLQPGTRLKHQIVIAAVPQLVPMGERPGHTLTHCLDRVLTGHLGVHWRKFLPPINDLGIVASVSW